MNDCAEKFEEIESIEIIDAQLYYQYFLKFNLDSIAWNMKQTSSKFIKFKK